MACPYFYPVEPAPGDARAPMLPLGGCWAGTCHAQPEMTCRPDETVVRPICNLGYARGRCSRFPLNDAGPDAVRFTIRRDDGRSLHLSYVLERDHHPFAQGPLDYELTPATFSQPLSNAILQRQAEAYVTSYLRYKR